MKIVINKCFGGFGVSKAFLRYYHIPYKKAYDVSRTDKRLIEYIEKFGSEKASHYAAKLVVEEIPNGELYRIDEYDGKETLVLAKDEKWLVAEDND